MQEIIKLIPSEQGSKAVSARGLYEFLGLSKAVFARWAKKNIEENPFALENADWVGFNIMLNGNETKDFALSLDFAKKLAMMSRTEKGEQARNYFLECEKEAVVVKSTPSPVQQIEAHTKRPVQIENAKGANKQSFQVGGKEHCIEWNVNVAKALTGHTPKELVQIGKDHGIPSKFRTSGKEVIRYFRPDKAAAVSVADFMHANGVEDNEAISLAQSALPVLSKLIELNSPIATKQIK